MSDAVRPTVWVVLDPGDNDDRDPSVMGVFTSETSALRAVEEWRRTYTFMSWGREYPIPLYWEEVEVED